MSISSVKLNQFDDRGETKKSPLNDFSDNNFEQMWSKFTKRKNQSVQNFVEKGCFERLAMVLFTKKNAI
ncbi:hypothetical protein, partial [Fischerella thermalis]